MGTHPWTVYQQVTVSVLYGLAIITSIFRTYYRFYISRFWWEDVWAMIALLFGIICLANVWKPRLPDLSPYDATIVARWVVTVALTSGLWAARMSMITAIVRITRHTVPFKFPAYATAIAFGIMWISVLVQKLYICATRSCDMRQDVATSQLVTDVVSDLLLMALPLYFLRGVKIEHNQRVLLVSSFTSSIFITIISITHSIFLFQPYTATSLILAHVKTALAIIICNLLVIVTLAYRLCCRDDLDVGATPTRSVDAQFTSVISGKWNLNSVLRSGVTSGHQSPSLTDGTLSRQ